MPKSVCNWKNLLAVVMIVGFFEFAVEFAACSVLMFRAVLYSKNYVVMKFRIKSEITD